jgi:hypothetical protein
MRRRMAFKQSDLNLEATNSTEIGLRVGFYDMYINKIFALCSKFCMMKLLPSKIKASYSSLSSYFKIKLTYMVFFSGMVFFECKGCLGRFLLLALQQFPRGKCGFGKNLLVLITLLV